LVAPLSEESFLTLLRERKLTHLPGAGGNRYASLMTWKMLLRMIHNGEHPAGLSEFRLCKNSLWVSPDQYLKRNAAGDGTVVNTARILDFMAHGISLAIAPIDPYAPHLKTLCENLRLTLADKIKMGVIVTTGNGGAFTAHYDPEDLIILQVEGRKRWKIFGSPVVNPVIGMPDIEEPSEDELIFDQTLEAGDFLFVPAGHWHRCENQSERSLHLGVFFQPPSALDAIKAITSQIYSDDVLRLPLTRLGDASNFSAIEADIKRHVIQRINELDLRGFVSSFGKT
jgi:hypothetical protein